MGTEGAHNSCRQRALVLSQLSSLSPHPSSGVLGCLWGTTKGGENPLSSFLFQPRVLGIWGKKDRKSHNNLGLELFCPLACRRPSIPEQLRSRREAGLVKDPASVLPLRPQFPSFSRGSLSSHGPETTHSFPSFPEPLPRPQSSQRTLLTSGRTKMALSL